MLLKLEPRGEASRAMVYLTPLLAILLTLIAGAILFAVLGHDPLEAM
jgi:simple sugar transport system permease protein